MREEAGSLHEREKGCSARALACLPFHNLGSVGEKNPLLRVQPRPGTSLEDPLDQGWLPADLGIIRSSDLVDQVGHQDGCLPCF